MMAKKKSSTSPAKQNDAGTIDFEASLADVEQIVSRLESGELGLTESLEQYETGIKQLKQCHALLDAAEQRVSVLSGFDADGNPLTQPLHGTATATGGAQKAKRSASRSASTPSVEKGSDDALNGGDAGGESVDDFPGLF